MLYMRGPAMAADAIRSYLAGLREHRDISQQRLADTIGITRVAWQRYENGTTENPNHAFVLDAMRALAGSFKHLQELAGPHATAERGRELAEIRTAQIAAVGELAALRDTLGDAEYEDLLRAIEADYQQKLDRVRANRRQNDTADTVEPEP